MGMDDENVKNFFKELNELTEKTLLAFRDNGRKYFKNTAEETIMSIARKVSMDSDVVFCKKLKEDEISAGIVYKVASNHNDLDSRLISFSFKNKEDRIECSDDEVEITYYPNDRTEAKSVPDAFQEIVNLIKQEGQRCLEIINYFQQ